MSTPRSQRIGIWIIAIVLILGTLGSFLVMALSVGNQKIDTAHQQKVYNKYLEDVAAQAKELSNKYYTDFSQFASTPAAYDASSVTELVKTDLKVGDGEEIKADTKYSAYYIGWNPKGKIFDQSIKDGALISPINGGNLITGWNEGVIGMKIGGIREIAIPSDKAYGSVEKSEDIPANTPLKFIVMVIPKVTEVPVPAELLTAK